jgi:urease accessory protein
MTSSRRLIVALFACTPALAAAHPSHEAAGTVEGLLHPLLGIDHLAAALMAGVWGAQRGGAARLALPAAFLAAVIAGLLLAPVAPIAPGAREQLIAVSLLAMGGTLAFAWRAPASVSSALAAGFAFFHGLAHGAERPAEGIPGYGTGLVVTTALLLTAGLVAGSLAQRHRAAALLRWVGVAGLAGGAALLA